MKIGKKIREFSGVMVKIYIYLVKKKKKLMRDIIMDRSG